MEKVGWTDLMPHLTKLLETLQIDLEAPNFKETPDRMARFLTSFLFPEEPTIKVFPSDSTQEVSLNGHIAWGLCPHHLLPVKYEINLSYIPNGKVFGISKLPRMINYLMHKLPLQEDLPKIIVDYVVKQLDVKACTCEVKGIHLCMVMRGVRSYNALFKTDYCYVKENNNES